MLDCRIIWLDDQEPLIRVFVNKLRSEGCRVDVATTVRDAEKNLIEGRYDLLILDVGIPPSREEEDPPSRAKGGKWMGLYLLEKWRETIGQRGMRVMVRSDFLDDAALYKRFSKAGLPDNCIWPSFEIKDPAAFLEAVKEVIDSPPPFERGV